MRNDSADYFPALMRGASRTTTSDTAKRRGVGSARTPMSSVSPASSAPDDLIQVIDGHDPVSANRITRSAPPGRDSTSRSARRSRSRSSGRWATTRPAGAEAHEAHAAAEPPSPIWSGMRVLVSARQKRGPPSAAGGFIGTAFRRRTSRAGDPHLHTPTSSSPTPPGATTAGGTLDGRHLYLHAKTAGYLYQARLRAGSHAGSASRGTRPSRLRRDRGIPPLVLRRFATRADEIRRRWPAHGTTSARRAVRRARDPPGQGLQRRRGHLAQHLDGTGRRLGFHPEDLQALLGKAAPNDPSPQARMRLRERLLGPRAHEAGEHVRPARRTACVLRAIHGRRRRRRDRGARRRDPRRPGGSPATTRGPPDRPARCVGEQPTGRSRRLAGARYSTSRYCARARLVRRAAAETATLLGVVAEDTALAAMAARPGLAREQVDMVATLTTSGRRVDVVIARQQARKASSRSTPRDAWQRAGHHVSSAPRSQLVPPPSSRPPPASPATPSPSSSSTSTTLSTADCVRTPWSSSTRPAWSARASSRESLTTPTTRTRSGPRRRPSPAPGDRRRWTSPRPRSPHRTDPSRQNRRQRSMGANRTQASFRNGRGRPSRRGIRRARSCTHLRDRRSGMMRWPPTGARPPSRASACSCSPAAGPTSTTSTLAPASIARATAGSPAQSSSSTNGRTKTGDRMAMLRNNRRLGARNGARKCGTSIDTGSMRVSTGAGSQSTLPEAYLDAGHVRHAYATTIHKAQGQTVGTHWSSAPTRSVSKAGYVALSRGRIENRIYLVEKTPSRATKHEAPPPEPLGALQRALSHQPCPSARCRCRLRSAARRYPSCAR